jgi:diguanylate cyclase (GGDEF)-like protein
MRLAWLVGGLLAAPVAVAALNGDPPFSRHEPALEVFPQNFAIAQDADGILYVANMEGVLVFDGERWTLVTLPDQDMVRSLAHDPRDGRVYVGSYDAFGYIQRDRTGREVYHDLTATLAEQVKDGGFGEIWDLLVLPQGILIGSVSYLFLYSPDTGSVRTWRPPGRIGAVASMGQTAVAQFHGEGLHRLVDGQWQLLPGSEPLADESFGLVALPGGGLLTVGGDSRWRVYHDGRIEDFPVPTGFSPASRVASALVLADGTLAFATDDGMMLLLDPASGASRQFRVDPGFLTRIIPAQDGGLFVLGDDAVIHVEWPSAWTVLGSGHGLSGSLHAVSRWNDRWYALTGAGVRILEPGPAHAPVFRRLDWAVGEAWDLLPLGEGQALLAESHALRLIEDGVARSLAADVIHPRVLLRSSADPDIVFVGGQPGLAVLRRSGADWHLAWTAGERDNSYILSLVEAGPRRLWLGTERSGVVELQFADDYSHVLSQRRFTAEDGIGYAQIPSATLAMLEDGSVVASNPAGFFRWDGQRFAATDLDGLDRMRGAAEWLQLAVSPAGERWAYSYSRLYRFRAGEGWKRKDVGSIRRGAIESLAFDHDGTVLMGSSYALLHFDPRRAMGVPDPVRPVLRAVERLAGDGTRIALPLDSGRLELIRGNFSLSLRFAQPDYLRSGMVRYSARLHGLEERFSEWSAIDNLTYLRLPAGDFRFELRARDSRGQISTMDELHLQVLPQWYETWWAQTLLLMVMFIALLVATLGLVQLRTRKLSADKLRLERLVAERTLALEALNKRLDAMAHVDGLTGVANRRDLDRYLQQSWARCEAGGGPLSVLAVDVDYFKQYNDRHGHLAGDEVLVRLVNVLAQCLPGANALLARFGGDEFFVVLEQTDADQARDLAEIMRRTVQDGNLGATVSIGVATGHARAGSSVRELVRTADQALYRAKDAGRNAVSE